jgi:O-antigen ligase
MKSRIESITDLKHPSNKARFIMWETGIRIIKDSPVIGFGDVDMNKLYRKYKTPEYHGEGSHMHNNAIQLLVDFGFIGFIAWFMLMLYIFLCQLKIYFRTKLNEFLNLLALISIVSMAALQITGLTEWNFGDAEFAAVFWFNLALAFAAWKIYSTPKAEKTSAI